MASQEYSTNVLVVDDQEANLIAMKALLKDLPANIVCVSSGLAALDALMKDSYALILLDISMPEMDGYETAKLIRGTAATKYTPIIFVTAAHTQELDQLDGYSAGALDYIVKPINPYILKSKVKIFIELNEYKAEVLRLRELVPICCNCKDIRDDKGYWQKIDTYFATYADTQFTHGICPECAKKLYPEVQGQGE